jgi:hypothetical protein
MSQTDSIRELSVAEIDEVAGGLSIGAGVDLSVKGLGKEVGSIGNAVDSTVGGLLNDVTGAVGSLLGGVL